MAHKLSKPLPDMSTRKHFVSIRDIERKIGVAPGYLNRIYNGQALPSFKMAVRIAEVLGITLDRFARSLPQKLLRRYGRPMSRRGIYGVPKFRSKTR